MDQNYVSPELTHFVGRKEPTDEARYDLLCRILDSEELLSNPRNPNRKGNMSIHRDRKLSSNERYAGEFVCFCDIQKDDLGIHMAKYSRLGLAFAKDFVAQRGGSPVFYIAKHAELPRASFAPHIIRGLVGTELDRLAEEVEKALVPVPGAGRQPDWNALQAAGGLSAHVFGMMKFFDHNAGDDSAENFYMEREWRVLADVRFTLTDVKRILIPARFVEQFRDDYPSYAGEVFPTDHDASVAPAWAAQGQRGS